MRLRAGQALGVAMGFCSLAPTALAQLSLPDQNLLCRPDRHPHDAVTAAPYSHRIMFEDEHVRVLEINLPPGASEPVHIHALPSVIFGDSGGGSGARFLYAEYRWNNGNFILTNQREVEPAPGSRAVWTGPEGPHALTNIGPVSVSFTRVEIKPEGCASGR